MCERKGKKMEKDIVELGTCCLAFAKTNKMLVIFRCNLQHRINSSSEGGNEISLLKLEKLLYSFFS
jgi:hypothetical protein